MAFVIKNNTSATNVLNELDRNARAMAKNLEKVSSGMKINSASDDASGYGIAERMDAQVRAIEQDDRNGQNATSMLKVATGALQSTVDILRTMKEKAISAANDTNTDVDRATIQKEFDQNIDQIADNATLTFNGKFILDGSHNNMVKPTHTTFTNASLSTDTSPLTRLTNLKDRNQNSLGILSSDTLTISFVKEGKTHVVSSLVGNSRVGEMMSAASGFLSLITTPPDNRSYIGQDQFDNVVRTPDNLPALSYVAATAGLTGQISGLTFNISDSNGNPRRTANTKLDEFTETIRAQNASPDNAMVFQLGAKANQAIKVGITDMRPYALGLRDKNGKVLNISTQPNANAAINVIDNAIKKVTDQLTDLGSVMNRLEYTSVTLVIGAENTQNAMSVIKDSDMAKESTAFVKSSILTQSAQAMLAQVNKNSSGVLSLLQ